MARKRAMVAVDLQDEELKRQAAEKAKREERTLSAVIRRLLRRWVREPNGPPGEGEG